MARITDTREASLSDKETVRELFYAVSLVERGKPIFSELIWVLVGGKDLDQHGKTLPDYCYNIFEVFRKTYFKGFPFLSETVQVTSQAELESAKTIEAAKKVVRLDWKNLGRIFGIAARCFRYAELEAGDDLKSDEIDDPQKICTMVFGKQWVMENQAKIISESLEHLFSEALKQLIEPQMVVLETMRPKWEALAYQWSPAAMVEFNEGMAEGINGFLDENGLLAGESRRSGIYGFLLLAWPEINAMLQSSPKKTLSDLHEWMQPFMRVGLTAYHEIDTLRDVCAPPPSGIGLSLRPLKSRRSKSSA